MQAPPGRYRVIERGRRLVVIDNLTGREAAGVSSRTPVAEPVRRGDTAAISAAPQTIDDQSGQPIITTSALYDLKGPRRIVLGEAAQKFVGQMALVAFFAGFVFICFAIAYPWLLIVPVFVALQPKAWLAVRQWATAQLDRLAGG